MDENTIKNKTQQTEVAFKKIKTENLNISTPTVFLTLSIIILFIGGLVFFYFAYRPDAKSKSQIPGYNIASPQEGNPQ